MKDNISFLLDENITPKADKYLKGLGFKSNHVVKMGYSGADDETVLNLARQYNSCLCTMNGKDFVIQVIPKTRKEHFGIFWSIDNVTRLNYIELFDLIIDFINKVGCVKNRIVEAKIDKDGFYLKPNYPKVQLFTYQH